MHQGGQSAAADANRPPLELIAAAAMQGVIRTYDPQTGEGIVVRDTDRNEYALASGALEGSLFRALRQGQRVTFELDADGRAAALRIGSEIDMGLGTARV